MWCVQQRSWQEENSPLYPAGVHVLPCPCPATWRLLGPLFLQQALALRLHHWTAAEQRKKNHLLIKKKKKKKECGLNAQQGWYVEYRKIHSND